MSIKKINPLHIILGTVSIFLTVSCSNRLSSVESIHTIQGKKIVLNSMVVCSNGPFNTGTSGKWYTGSGKANTSFGELIINCDFGNTISEQPAFSELNPYYSIPMSIAGNTNFSPQFLHITISLDKKNMLFTEYPGANDNVDGGVFGTTAAITGGTGIFINAKGTINSKIQIDRFNHTAIAIHSGVIYLE